MFKTDNQQWPPGWHREPCPGLRGSLDGSRVWGRMDTCTCVVESLCCPPETITSIVNQLSSNIK